MSKDNDAKKNQIASFAKYMPNYLANELLNETRELCRNANEIRLRVNKPAVIVTSTGYKILCEQRPISPEEIRETFEKLCDYSIYSHQSELAEGFITLPGGHRAGICGTAATDSNGNRTLKYVSSINIRISNEYIGCSNEIFEKAFEKGLCGLLISGPPCSGKTTVLRDIALSLSSQPYDKNVVIVDERGEIAAVHRGEPQNTLGIFCDVLNGYPKGEGILNAVRTLAPNVIICDEIGGEHEVEAVCQGLNAGVTVISTIHACNIDELYRREQFKKLLGTGAFEKVAFLKDGCRGVLSDIIEVGNNGS